MKRESYIDNIKILACMLVVIGHLLKSMVESGLMSGGAQFDMWMEVLYSFHVNLFFMCSGYLYQKYTKIDSFSAYGRHLLKKVKSIVIPYFIFTIITVALKNLAADSVNSTTDGYLTSLFISPISPYWYLYAIMIMFILIPIMKNKCMAIGMSIMSVAMILLYWKYFTAAPIAVYYFFGYSAFFVLGMFMAYTNISTYVEPKRAIIVLVLLAIMMSFIIYEWYNNGLFFSYIRQVNGLLVCGFIMVLFILVYKGREQSALSALLSKYTMAIFLMHTIFASGVRMVLMKMNIRALWIHLALEMIAGIIGPMIVWKAYLSIKNRIFRKKIVTKNL